MPCVKVTYTARCLAMPPVGGLPQGKRRAATPLPDLRRDEYQADRGYHEADCRSCEDPRSDQESTRGLLFNAHALLDQPNLQHIRRTPGHIRTTNC